MTKNSWKILNHQKTKSKKNPHKIHKQNLQTTNKLPVKRFNSLMLKTNKKMMPTKKMIKTKRILDSELGELYKLAGNLHQ